MEIKVITAKQKKDEFEAVTKKGKWTDLIEAIKKDKKPRKITGLTRGQVAALYRKAKDEGLDSKTSYKDGSVVLAVVEEPVAEKKAD